jgi:ABC-type uncharacterized transport system substrate-binding protein
MIARRAILALLGVMAALPLRSTAQAKRFHIAWLDTGVAGSLELKAFQKGLLELGYVEGRNTIIDYRWADGQITQLPTLAAELVSLNPDVIVTRSSASIQAAKVATVTIPIVFANGDPVGQGFAASLAHPGGNLTGLSMNQRDLLPKRLQLFKQTMPWLSRLAVLINPTDPVTVLYTSREFNDAAQSLGIRLSSVSSRGAGDLAGAFTMMAQNQSEAAMVLGGAVFYDQRQRIVDLALAHRLPLASEAGEYVDAGGFISFGIDIQDIYRRAAEYVDKILKGALASDLPIEQPNKYEFVVNVRTARLLGITIPSSILARADRVIE